MEKNKTGKYFKYAVGEIVLVVIGILIALQINNLNDIQNSKNLEVQLLESLHSEFQNNLIKFDTVFKYHKRKEDYVNNLIDFNNHPIPFQKLDSILSIIPYNYTIDLSGTIYKSSVSSGKIELINNSRLKNRIANFEDLLIDFKEEEMMVQDMTINHVSPFINDNIVLRFPHGERTETELAQDKFEYINLVKNAKFRNRLINLTNVCWDITSEGKAVRKEIIYILDAIKIELKNK